MTTFAVRLLWVVVLAAVQAFAFGSEFGAWFAEVVSLTFAMTFARHHSIGAAFVWGYAFGFLSLAAVLAWIPLGARPHLGIGIFAIAAGAIAVEALPTAFGGAVFAFASRRSNAAFLLGAPAVAALLKSSRANGTFALPLATIGTSQIDGPLASTIAIGGVPLATFATLALAAAFAASRSREGTTRRAGGLAVVVVVTLAIASGLVWRYDLTRPRSVVARLGIVQAGPIDRGLSFGAEADRYGRATDRLANRALDGIVWPEGVLFLTEPDSSRQRAAARRAAGVAGVPVLIGATIPTRGSRENVSLVARPGGELRPVYVKRRLVPFGEYQPFAFSPDSARSYSAGVGPAVVADASGRARFGILICYEVAFPDLARASMDDGAAYLVAQVNDSWFAGSAGPAQQTALTRARAIEMGDEIVQADAVAPSGAIEPDGTWAALLDRDGEAVATVRAPIVTPYRSSKPVVILVVLVIVAFVAFGAPRRAVDDG